MALKDKLTTLLDGMKEYSPLGKDEKPTYYDHPRYNAFEATKNILDNIVKKANGLAKTTKENAQAQAKTTENLRNLDRELADFNEKNNQTLQRLEMAKENLDRAKEILGSTYKKTEETTLTYAPSPDIDPRDLKKPN